MTDESLKKELEQLRAEVAALSAARREAAAPAEGEQQVEGTADQTEGAATAAETGLTDELKDHMHELMELLEAEVRDLPASTCLVVFSLGILMGRWLR
jgi:hypothetical protein